MIVRAVAPADMSQLVALAKSGRYGDMEIKAREVANACPHSGFAWKALGVALQMQGKDALQSLAKAAQLLPNDAEAQSNLGSAQRRVGRLDDAVASYRRALAINPDIAEVCNNFGNVLRDLGRLDEALAAFRRAIALKPDFAKSHNNLGRALQDLGKLEDAVASYRRAIVLEPGYAEAHTNLGVALRLQSRAPEAEMSCRRALELDPNSAAAIILLAELQSDQGQFLAAEESFRHALAADPESADAWSGIAGLRKMTHGDSDWLAGAQRIADQPPTPRSEISLRYAIGKYFDDVGDFAQAFVNYRRANELTKMHRPAHDRRQLELAVNCIIDSYGHEWLRDARTHSNSSPRPLFIVGMPRSGTTLAEQILASHSRVFGAGELPYWNTAASQYGASRADGGNEPEALSRWARDYLAILDEKSADALRVVDKMPANFLHLGLIHAAFPNARIIHMRRNAIDTCLSIYFQNFGTIHSYANDLEDLAHYYTEYLRVMQHWRDTLAAEAMLEVSYEALVADPERLSRRILEFTGLPWEPNCCEFHQTGRTVSTFSKWQVRQKISTSSVERWRNYADFMEPLSRLA